MAKALLLTFDEIEKRQRLKSLLLLCLSAFASFGSFHSVGQVSNDHREGQVRGSKREKGEASTGSGPFS